MTAATCFAICFTTLLQGRIHTDYFPAYIEARNSGKMLLIDFGTGFDFKSVEPKKLEGYVLCRVPVDYKIPVKGKKERLIDAPAFAFMQQQPGLAVVDLRHKPLLGGVVSVLPQRYTAAGYVAALLDLPAGTLTQRTLIFAFRTHQDQPPCCQGKADPTLMNHADQHSTNQANSNAMYHSGSFPGSFEIVAQSWAGGNIVDAAVDLVNLWRSSPPHWGAASTPWSYYGVDMQSNGSGWYATGVFQ